MAKKKILISLVSDQTIPNVQLIKEYGDEDTDYLFVSTPGMEKKGCRKWIEKCCNISDAQFVNVSNQFSYEEVQQKLATIDFDIYAKIIVNITGGTKIMSVAASDFFKEIGAEIFYVTGINQEYIRTFPKKKSMDFKLGQSVSLSEYLYAYGFEFNPTEQSGISFEQSEIIFNNYSSLNINEYVEEFAVLRSKRGKTLVANDYPKVRRFIDAIDYTPQKEGELSKIETKYLTGEWFEEYVGGRIKKELSLSDNNILIGTVITKNASIPQNSITTLLGIEDNRDVENTNEMDVIFMHQNQFYAIECKTSIVDYRSIETTNGLIRKPYNILGETIYKLDSLKSRFGLFAKASIVTLTNFKDYVIDNDINKQNNKIHEMKSLIERADLSRIKLVDNSLLRTSESLINLLK